MFINEKIESLKIQAQILEEHLKEYGHLTTPEAYAFIKRNIELIKAKIEMCNIVAE